MKLVSYTLKIFLCLAFASLGSVEVFASVIYVPSDSQTISEALSKAYNGDVIQIAPGRYFESNLEMRSGVTLIGSGVSSDQVIIDGSNMGRILWCESLSSSTNIQNITFTNGKSAGEAIYDQSGGAILFSNCSPKIINCTFINNNADASGGAIRCTNASPEITNCTFINNSAGDGGGGIDCSYESSPIITKCFFKNNQSRWGGGLSCRGNASPIVSETGFDRNTASGVNMGFGGAIFADYEARPVFMYSTFYGNEAQYGGGLACFDNSQTNLFQCSLIENNAIWIGEGIFCKEASPVIQSSILAFHDGMAIAVAGAAVPHIEYSDIFNDGNNDWSGAIADQEGGTNFSVDPLFCGYNPDQDFHFGLSEESPLGSQYNVSGFIGAWDVGCSPLAEALEFSAVWNDEHPTITWELDAVDDGSIFRLTRAIATHYPDEEDLTFSPLGDNKYSAVDVGSSPVQGWQYIYRLYSLDPREGWILLADFTLESVSSDNRNMNILAYPNPFNPSTTIKFDVDRTQLIRVSVFDLRGNRIAVLENSVMEPGSKNILWHGEDKYGRRVSSGTYFVVIQGDSSTRSKKIMMLE